MKDALRDLEKETKAQTYHFRAILKKGTKNQLKLHGA